VNYLQICQDAVREAGIPGGGPSDVQNQTNILNDFVVWTRDAWVEIQSEKDWDFRRGNKTVVLVAGTQDYDIYGTAVGNLAWTDLAAIDPNSKIIVTRPDGAKYYLNLMQWDDYRARYGLATNVQNAPPIDCTITPDQKLRFMPPPDDAYSIDFPYWKTPTVLTAKTDTPAILANFHKVITWRAVKKFAAKKEAWALHGKADTQESTVYHELMRKYLPPVTAGACPITGM
jgi:hypothetical protein